MPLCTTSSANRLHSVTIDTFGCRITSLVLGGKTIFWSGLRPDGKEAATHPCLPQFRVLEEGMLAKLPQHGPARKEEWKKVNQEKQQPLVFTWQMKEVTGVYPAGLEVERRFELTEEGVFTLTMRVQNTGNQALPINPGEHCYFHCSLEKRSGISLNGKSVKRQTWQDQTEYRQLQADNSLFLPETGDISVRVEGYEYCALWSVEGAAFICCEPIWEKPETVYDPRHLLKPNQNKEFVLVIS